MGIKPKNGHLQITRVSLLHYRDLLFTLVYLLVYGKNENYFLKYETPDGAEVAESRYHGNQFLQMSSNLERPEKKRTKSLSAARLEDDEV